ncbi:MAG TPA: hypothetical protein VF908_04005 [Gemmatimonadaceae bacterium]
MINHEAAAAVAHEDLAFDGVGNVPRGRCPRVVGRSQSRLPTRGESLFHHLFDEQVECLLEDCRQVSIRNSVPEQILGPAELVMTRATPGELELERVLGERRNHGPAFLAAHGGWRCEGQNRRRVRRRRRNGDAEGERGGLGRGIPRLRKLADDGRDRGLRCKARNQLFDLALRLAGCLRQHLFLVFASQVRRERA